MKFYHTLFIVSITAIALISCDKQDDAGEPLLNEPIKITAPGDLIIYVSPGETVPINISVLLPNALDSLTALYYLNGLSLIAGDGKKFSGNAVQGTYEGEFVVPDSLPAGSFIRGNFHVSDILDSVYSKSLKMNVVE